jgi:hypothetical protein
MATAGPAIPILAPVATRFAFGDTLVAVNLQIRFFSDDAGLVPLAPGTGSATLTASHSSFWVRGEGFDAQRINGGALVPSTWPTAVIVAAPDGQWQERPLGGGATALIIVPSLIVAPGAVTYSIVVDAKADAT